MSDDPRILSDLVPEEESNLTGVNYIGFFSPVRIEDPAEGRRLLDFASVTGTALDESNVREALNRILDAAGLDRRGPHQMRHTFASLLLQDGVPITYVAAQLGHHDPSITLRVYSHWLPDASHTRLVDRLDEPIADAPQAHPRRSTRMISKQ